VKDELLASWNDIFWKYVRKGHDRSSAAYEADRWQARNPVEPSCCSTHCERAQECRSPHDCCGDYAPQRALASKEPVE